ncbi:Ldh family oxidoreductase, partial [Klebsiella michiganensis]
MTVSGTTSRISLVACTLCLATIPAHAVDLNSQDLIPAPAGTDAILAYFTYATLTMLSDAGPIVSFDGGHGFGQALGEQAMAVGIERAREFGVAIIGLSNTHHLGRIGAWAEQAADAGLVSLHFANVAAPSVVLPFDGLDARLGTNP